MGTCQRVGKIRRFFFLTFSFRFHFVHKNSVKIRNSCEAKWFFLVKNKYKKNVCCGCLDRRYNGVIYLCTSLNENALITTKKVIRFVRSDTSALKSKKKQQNRKS